MTKFLLVICAVLFVAWVIKGVRRKKNQRNAPKSTISEDMVRCVHCGVHLPRSESLVTQGQYFCSADHRRRHRPNP